jgi:hypothetical protein
MSALVKEFLLFVKLQWIDRAATSSFLIGLSIQSFILCLSVWDKSSSPQTAGALAVRAAFMTSIGITLFAAMSSLANEIRFGTFYYVILGKKSLMNILMARSVSNTFISLSAIILPFIIAAIKFPSLIEIKTFLAILLIFITITLLCFQTALILNSLPNPVGGIPWLKYGYVLIGLNLLPFPLIHHLSRSLPFYWISQIFESQEKLWHCIAYCLLSLFLWTLTAWLLMARKALKNVAEIQSKSKMRNA